MIQYRKGDATQPDTSLGQRNYILHICNDQGGWGRGFVKAISRRWPEPEQRYRAWFKHRHLFEMGMVQFTRVEDQLYVVNMVAQHKFKTHDHPVPLSYEELATCLRKVAGRISENDAIHMPRIGCGLAGGTWEKVESIIKEAFSGLPNLSITVYDL